MRYLLPVAVVVAVVVFHLAPARAHGDQPWCSAVTYDHSVVRNCVFRTFAECLPEIAGGNRGFCEQNPDWFGRPHQAEAPKRRHTRRVKRD
jgi:Protein of unknown function (DUF3551)